MAKMVTVEGRVDDLSGLLLELKQSAFAVLNVAAQGERTFVYLEDVEEKDPAPAVSEWVGKAKPRADHSVWAKRKAAFAAFAAAAPPPPPPPAPVPPQDPAVPVEGAAPQSAPEAAPAVEKKEGWFKSWLKKIF